MTRAPLPLMQDSHIAVQFDDKVLDCIVIMPTSQYFREYQIVYSTGSAKIKPVKRTVKGICITSWTAFDIRQFPTFDDLPANLRGLYSVRMQQAARCKRKPLNIASKTVEYQLAVPAD